MPGIRRGQVSYIIGSLEHICYLLTQVLNRISNKESKYLAKLVGQGQ